MGIIQGVIVKLETDEHRIGAWKKRGIEIKGSPRHNVICKNVIHLNMKMDQLPFMQNWKMSPEYIFKIEIKSTPTSRTLMNIGC